MEEIIHLYHLSFVADYESIRFERKRSDQIQIVLNFLTFFFASKKAIEHRKVNLSWNLFLW